MRPISAAGWWPDSRGAPALGKGEALQPVRASDITVLVRSRNEAGLIRDALNALSIPSVYLSSRDSVYTTPEARELLWLLAGDTGTRAGTSAAQRAGDLNLCY
ncbi:Exodeoxyribonuclease V beta chain [Pantoea agglomerans]|uniref:Exodeoxyribonuclease V beta chain n=1 Tax=Enterobacter agglomerans TaxID=549 RepID=A0A379ABP9_ENTAG|nr:Exodeoxyribonuclease V beta chain [Pantoea agglomerans]